MPEGDTIYRAARALNRALTRRKVTRFKTVLPKLSRTDADAPLAGRTVENVESRGKWLLMRFSGGLTLVTHMLMNGSWHIYRPGEAWQRRRDDMRIVIETAEIIAVCFGVQVAEFHSDETLARHPSLARLGPDLLGEEFDEEQAIANFRTHPELAVADALLAQSLLAGAGNVYKSELCFLCAVSPFRAIAQVTDDELKCLVQNARKLLKANVGPNSPAAIVTYTGIRRTTRRADPGSRLWVYGRAGQPCRKCGTVIKMKKHGAGARVTFWCPKCQN